MNYLYRNQPSPLISMIKARTFLFGIVLFLSAPPLITAGQQGESTNILVLFSLSPITPAYHLIMDGIRTRLTEEFGDGYTLHTEYLESERYPKGSYPRGMLRNETQTGWNTVIRG
jgi:hypothetical protein